MPVSLSLSHIPLSTLCHSPSHSPSHASLLHSLSLTLSLSPSQPLHPLTPLHLHTNTLSRSRLSLSHASLTLTQFSQIWFSYCVIFSCGFVVFVPKLWLIWLFRVLLCLVPKKMREKFSILCWDCHVWEILTWGN